MAVLGCESTSPVEVDGSAASDAASTCTADEDCDDGSFCSGIERCDPASPDADARGCLAGEPPCTGPCSEELGRCESGACDRDGDGADAYACGGDDCDDGDATRFPGNPELCDASHDEDCDLLTVGVRDADGDTYVDIGCCNIEGSTTTCGNDCMDSGPGSAGVHPMAMDICNGIDDNCNGSVDEGSVETVFVDCDGDGWGEAGTAIGGCHGTPLPEELDCATGATYVRARSLGPAEPDVFDCDDSEASVAPLRPDGCPSLDGMDNDCDRATDEDGGPMDGYLSCDGDDYGVTATRRLACLGELPASSTLCPPGGRWVARGGDCRDDTPTAYPMAPEQCDGIDNDCDSTVDEGVGAGVACDASGDGCARGTRVCRAVGGTWGLQCDGDTACPGGEECRAGTCRCPDGQVPCGGRCQAVGGACTNGCGVGTFRCGGAGVIECSAAYIPPSRTCTNYCGTGTETCSAGTGYSGCTAPASCSALFCDTPWPGTRDGGSGGTAAAVGPQRYDATDDSIAHYCGNADLGLGRWQIPRSHVGTCNAMTWIGSLPWGCYDITVQFDVSSRGGAYDVWLDYSIGNSSGVDRRYGNGAHSITGRWCTCTGSCDVPNISITYRDSAWSEVLIINSVTFSRDGSRCS